MTWWKYGLTYGCFWFLCFSCNLSLPWTVSCLMSLSFYCFICPSFPHFTFTFHLFIKACPTNCHCHFLSSILAPLALRALLPQGPSLWEMRADQEGELRRVGVETCKDNYKRRVAVREGSREVESGDVKSNCTSNAPWLLMDNNRHGNYSPSDQSAHHCPPYRKIWLSIIYKLLFIPSEMFHS